MKNRILINPRLPLPEQNWWLEKLSKAPFNDHVWVATSGSSGNPKWAAISNTALEVSAHAVNKHINASKSDIWINPLPTFHVGGLGIIHRAQLTESLVIPFTQKWDPCTFIEALSLSKATLTSLVPTQLFDLIHAQTKAPSSLRGCIIGGGALSPALYTQAQSLGWPLLPSYGLTECASQVATATHENPALKILDHVSCKISPTGKLSIKSEALLTCYAVKNEQEVTFFDPKIEGWFETEDQAELNNTYLIILGRDSHFIKIGGESVNLNQLRMKLELNGTLIAYPDERLGHVIHLVATSAPSEEAINRFNDSVSPYERIRKVHIIPAIPTTGPGKIDYNNLMKMILL